MWRFETHDTMVMQLKLQFQLNSNGVFFAINFPFGYTCVILNELMGESKGNVFWIGGNVNFTATMRDHDGFGGGGGGNGIVAGDRDYGMVATMERLKGY